MITEDYCSFEIAELLKEKGFDGECDYWYDKYRGRCCSPSVISVECWCPSQSLALKWLRKVHKINIVIGVASDDDNIYSLWKFDIWNGNYSIIWGDKREKFNYYEQAVEAALKYTLENLI